MKQEPIPGSGAGSIWITKLDCSVLFTDMDLDLVTV